MKKLEYTVRFVTPAFLGNAEQQAQWRTPPFKAQLRQWWRVAYAAQGNFSVNVQTMRCEEGRLFGNAWLENDFRKSLVCLCLEHWNEGQLKSWPYQYLMASLRRVLPKVLEGKMCRNKGVKHV